VPCYQAAPLSLQIGESKISLETKSENIKERCTRTKYKGSIAKQKNAQIFSQHSSNDPTSFLAKH
jgi:hypothetical protein